MSKLWALTPHRFAHGICQTLFRVLYKGCPLSTRLNWLVTRCTSAAHSVQPHRVSTKSSKREDHRLAATTLILRVTLPVFNMMSGPTLKRFASLLSVLFNNCVLLFLLESFGLICFLCQILPEHFICNWSRCLLFKVKILLPWAERARSFLKVFLHHWWNSCLEILHCRVPVHLVIRPCLSQTGLILQAALDDSFVCGLLRSATYAPVGGEVRAH